MNFRGPGLKTGVEIYIVSYEIGSGFGEPGGTPLTKIPRGSPPKKNISKDGFSVISVDLFAFSILVLVYYPC